MEGADGAAGVGMNKAKADQKRLSDAANAPVVDYEQPEPK
jgi:hypothetical protein